MSDRLTRARASLLGTAVGDALGEAVASAAGAESNTRAPGESRALPPAPWRWTDDTEMACSVLHVLHAHSRLDPDALADSFVRHYDPTRNYGAGVDAMMAEVARHGTGLRQLAEGNFGGAGSWGNGGAMRVAPLGSWFAGDPATAAREAAVAAEVTHTHPEGVAGAVAVAVAASLAASGAPADELLDTVLDHTPPGQVNDGIRTATALTGVSPVVAAAALGTGRQLSAPDTVPLALWAAARHLDDYAEAVWTVAPVAEDTDTVCAIVGGIVGGRVGARGIPRDWRDCCEPLPAWLLAPTT